ncbi:FeoA family protein [Thermosyntropha sp.]|uniref:FeoA family protein n=1 Tax=Thermosyntropha sp. TaxID=2740820 RepID=UPI0025E56C77|nr:FeoA family protein [Thermosyntropha sp.]MBO8158925.1 ferrous iron transport protein A [Thermosyntropha sp.]
MRLSDLKVGQKGIIDLVDLDGSIKRRLLDLGFVPGTEIKSVRKSPAGSPIVFELRDTLIALRKKEAYQIFVETK